LICPSGSSPAYRNLDVAIYCACEQEAKGLQVELRSQSLLAGRSQVLFAGLGEVSFCFAELLQQVVAGAGSFILAWHCTNIGCAIENSTSTISIQAAGFMSPKDKMRYGTLGLPLIKISKLFAGSE
jgi:hypothetical protein